MIAGCQRSGVAGIVPGQSNVLLVIIDTLRADHLGAFGYPYPTSPGLDRLASDGVLFEQTYSNCSWTRPSIASLLTGLYPRATGVSEEQFDRLAADITTLAERFQAAGYVTLGLTSNPNVNAFFGFDQGFDAWGDSGHHWDWMPESEDGHADEGLENATVVTDRALEVLDRHAATLETAPFYLQVLYIDPHTPYAAPEPFRTQLSSATSQYDAEIRFVDAELRRLLDGLAERGLLEDTLVVVTSDHGEGLDSHSNLPLAGTHGYTLYDSVTHVPLLFWHPSLEPARVAALTQLLDLAPTLAELFALPLGESLPGSSLVPFFEEPERSAQVDVVISETDWRFVSKVSARSSTHRYIRNLGAARFRANGSYEGRRPREAVAPHFDAIPDEELYALGDTGGFEHPRLNECASRVPDVAQRLRGEIASWERLVIGRPPENRSSDDSVTLADGTRVPAPEAMTEVHVEDRMGAQLRALGYLGED